MRLFRKKPLPGLIPETELSSVLRGNSAIRLSEPCFQTGNVTLEELAALSFIVKERDPGAVFEMGTFDGRTTLNIALNTGEGAKIYTLDLPREKLNATKLPVTSGDRDLIDKETSGARFALRREAGKITQLYGDTAVFDFAPYEDRMDLVFIDASHSYEYVLNDSRIAFKLLRNGKGTVLWHDYGSCGEVTEALNELYRTRPEMRSAGRLRNTSLVCLIL
jgi:predicted O-methyltransferase YrrM